MIKGGDKWWMLNFHKKQEKTSERDIPSSIVTTRTHQQTNWFNLNLQI